MYALLEVSATNTKQSLIQNITQTHTDISTQNQLTKSRKWEKKKFCFIFPSSAPITLRERSRFASLDNFV